MSSPTNIYLDQRPLQPSGMGALPGDERQLSAAGRFAPHLGSFPVPLMVVPTVAKAAVPQVAFQKVAVPVALTVGFPPVLQTAAALPAAWLTGQGRKQKQAARHGLRVLGRASAPVAEATK